MSTSRLIPIVSILFTSIACGDITSSTGELGRIEYSLSTHYKLDQSLIDTSILTGHTQSIDVGLTYKGSSDADDPSSILHSIRPSDGATISWEESINEAPDINILVTEPGIYTIESSLNGTLFDKIDLNFADPSEYSLITWLRSREETEFRVINETAIPAMEGDQAAFLAVPYDNSGNRIAGEMALDMSASPSWAVSQGFNVLEIYEQTVSGGPAPVSVYFIEPGNVEISWSDRIHAITTSQAFTVAPVNP
jgi:hypothetical protein